MKHQLRWNLVAVAIIVIVATLGCQVITIEQKTAQAEAVTGAEKEEPINIRLGFNTWVGYGPFYIAQEKGFFAEHGLNVDLQRIEGTADRRSALIAGRLEGMGSTVDDLIISAAQGVKGKMVLALDESAGADGILTVKDINDVQDFKGKEIAVQPGFVNHFFLLYILDANGLSSKDITVVPMDPDKASAAFIAKEVDVAVTWEPYLSQVAEDRPDGKTFLTSNDYPGLIVDILVFNNDFIEKEPDAVRAFVDAWYEALDFLATNPEEGHAIIGQAMGLDSAEVGDILSGVKFLAEDDNVQYYDRSEAVNIYDIAATAERLWQNEGFIDQPLDVNNLIEASFLSGSQ